MEKVRYGQIFGLQYREVEDTYKHIQRQVILRENLLFATMAFFVGPLWRRACLWRLSTEVELHVREVL